MIANTPSTGHCTFLYEEFQLLLQDIRLQSIKEEVSGRGSANKIPGRKTLPWICLINMNPEMH